MADSLVLAFGSEYANKENSDKHGLGMLENYVNITLLFGHEHRLTTRLGDYVFLNPFCYAFYI